jgi:Ca2+-dependent lipid-binding protein
MSNTGGHLVLHVEEAKVTRDTELFGTMDPYCEIKFNGKTTKTPVKTDAGKTPKWNFRMELEVEDVMAPILFKIMNKNLMSDDQICHTQDLKIYNLLGPNNGMTEDFHTYYEKKDRGNIKIRSQFTPNAPAAGTSQASGGGAA